MSIDLTPFCANEWEIRDWMRMPWTANGWTYATNGHLAVRVPSTEPDTEQPGTRIRPNNIAGLFRQHLEEEQGEFLLFPPLLPVQPCMVCGGTGVVDDDDGPEACINCWGTKVDFTYQALGDAGFNSLYLHQLAALPQARIRTHGPQKAAAVIFDGGQALLMPMDEERP